MADPDEDVAMEESPSLSKSRPSKGYQIVTRTITAPPFSYIHLELISDSQTEPVLDNLTVHSHINAALSQFLGLTGTAIPIDILKVEGSECWIRLPREDLSPVLAAVGGWMGGRRQSEANVSWKIRASGNWLSALVGRSEMRNIWIE